MSALTQLFKACTTIVVGLGVGGGDGGMKRGTWWGKVMERALIEPN